MAAFREHIAFSTVLGVGYAVGLKSLGFEPAQAVLAGSICSLSGMLPDLDSDSGRPVREMFSFIAAACSILIFHKLGDGNLEFRLLLAGGMYLFMRFGFSYLFKQLTVHRGMCHSIPAALIAAISAYLLFVSEGDRIALAMAGGVLIGFVSHLLLDEIYAVDFRGLKPKLNQFAGSALKLFSKNTAATVVTWGLLFLLSYRVAVVEGVLPEGLPSVADLREARNSLFEKLGISKDRGKPLSMNTTISKN
ncbi:MAG: metal-dependent hydrolase [Planctomycetia bacterium]|nr:metal-dependent hydrolase [Planctomycetia bacterium]